MLFPSLRERCLLLSIKFERTRGLLWTEYATSRWLSLPRWSLSPFLSCPAGRSPQQSKPGRSSTRRVSSLVRYFICLPVSQSLKTCPTEPGQFFCAVYKGGSCNSFCGRTVTTHLKYLAVCGRSSSAAERNLLITSCEKKCVVAQQSISTARSLSVGEQKVLEGVQFATCDGKCRAGIMAQVRRRCPHALVFTALTSGKPRAGFHLFSRWVRTESSTKTILCGNHRRICRGIGASPFPEPRCWFCALSGSKCPAKCSPEPKIRRCWTFSLECLLPPGVCS